LVKAGNTDTGIISVPVRSCLTSWDLCIYVLQNSVHPARDTDLNRSNKNALVTDDSRISVPWL